MKCPMLKSRYTFQDSEKRETEAAEFQNCIGEECAWWHTYKDEQGRIHTACATIHIADALKENNRS